MITGQAIQGNFALWFIDPAILYHVNNNPIGDVLASIYDDAGHGEITVQDCISAVVNAIPSGDVNDLAVALLVGNITHDHTASATKLTITANATDSTTITTGFTNAYHAVCYLDGELVATFGNQTGAFEFATYDEGEWRLLFVDARNYETSEITITAGSE